MKRYKLLTQRGYSYLKEGEIYNENMAISDNVIKHIVEFYPEDWEEVVEKGEADEEIVDKLVDEYWFSEDCAKEFLSKFNEMKKVFNIEITIYQAVDLINYFK